MGLRLTIFGDGLSLTVPRIYYIWALLNAWLSPYKRLHIWWRGTCKEFPIIRLFSSFKSNWSNLASSYIIVTFFLIFSFNFLFSLFFFTPLFHSVSLPTRNFKYYLLLKKISLCIYINTNYRLLIRYLFIFALLMKKK